MSSAWLFVCALACARIVLASREDAMGQTLPAYAIALRADLLNSTECRADLENFRNAIDRRTLWSLKVLDSSGGAKPGFLYGNNYWFGIRSQCFDSANRQPLMVAERERLNNSKYRSSDEEFPPFAVNYFVAVLRHNSTLQYHVRLPNEDLVNLGLCLPASCSSSEIGTILRRIFHDESLLIGDLFAADFELMEVRDLQDDHQWLANWRIVTTAIVLALSVLMVLVGTMYDVCVHQKYLKAKNKSLDYDRKTTLNGNKRTADNTEAGLSNSQLESRIGKFLMCFSFYTNTKIILGTKLGSESIPEIHGLRFMGMMWIVMIHTIFYMSDYADNKTLSWRYSEGVANQVISNSTLSVDTFFFLSGFLIAYLYLNARKGKDEEKPARWSAKVSEFFAAVLQRFIRLTPAYMMVVGIAEMNYGWYGNTSQFYMSERPHEVCAKYWWRNLLYVNNVFGRETMCLSWSWYLSNDMQFFVIATFLLILSSISFSIAAGILVTLLVSSTVISGYLSYIYGYVPTLDEQYHFLDILYDPPWTRIGPHIVGMITAYCVIKLNNKLHMKRRNLVMCWIAGSSCNILTLFGLWQRDMSVLSAAFYVAFNRTVWALGIAWLLIACRTKHGGIIQKILSFKAWIPLSRLTYCAYLLNPLLINSVYLHMENTAHLDFLPNGTIFVGNLVTTYACAYALSLLLETPYVLLMRLLMNPSRRRSS